MAVARKPLPQFGEADLDDRRLLIHKLRTLVRELEQDGGGGSADALTEVTAEDIDSESANDGHVLTADGSGGSAFEALPSSGEANTTSNDGAGEGLAKAKSGVDLPFKSLTEGQGIKLTGSANEVKVEQRDTRVDHGNVSTGTEDLDWAAGRVHEITATGDFTITTSGWPASGVPADMEIILYDADLHTVTLPSWTWSGESEPTLTGHERIILRSDDGGTTVYAMQAFSESSGVGWGDITGNEVDAAQAIKDHGTVSSGTETLDLNDGLTHKVTAGGDFTVAVDSWPASGIRGELEIVAVDWGAHTVTLPGAWDWGDDGAPTFSSSGTDYIILRTNDGGTTVHAMLSGSGF